MTIYWVTEYLSLAEIKRIIFPISSVIVREDDNSAKYINPPIKPRGISLTT
jgi:hypothetical protein